MRIPLHLDCTTFSSLGVSDVETMQGFRFELLRSSSPTILWIPSDEHDSRFQEIQVTVCLHSLTTQSSDVVHVYR
ncbi:hypothetical protein J6590_011462, partial [Homalodisca vitripennis]